MKIIEKIEERLKKLSETSVKRIKEAGHADDDMDMKKGDDKHPAMKGTTSENAGHSHKYSVDAEGNGETDTSKTDDPHAHLIEKWKVKAAGGDNHNHILASSEAVHANGKKKKNDKMMSKDMKENIANIIKNSKKKKEINKK